MRRDRQDARRHGVRLGRDRGLELPPEEGVRERIASEDLRRGVCGHRVARQGGGGEEAVRRMGGEAQGGDVYQNLLITPLPCERK